MIAKQNNGSSKLATTSKHGQAGALPSTSKSSSVPAAQSVVQHMSQGGSQVFAPCDFQFYTVDAEWQQQPCNSLGLEYHRPNRFATGSPSTALTHLNFQTVQRITGDGNCLFRSFPLIITGSQEHHVAVCVAILQHMQTITHLLLGPHVKQTSIANYIHEMSIWTWMVHGAQMLKSCLWPTCLRPLHI